MWVTSEQVEDRITNEKENNFNCFYLLTIQERPSEVIIFLIIYITQYVIKFSSFCFLSSFSASSFFIFEIYHYTEHTSFFICLFSFYCFPSWEYNAINTRVSRFSQNFGSTQLAVISVTRFFSLFFNFIRLTLAII